MDKFPPKPPKGPNPDIAPFPKKKNLCFLNFFGIPVFLQTGLSHKNPGNVKNSFKRTSPIFLLELNLKKSSPRNRSQQKSSFYPLYIGKNRLWELFIPKLPIGFFLL
jgi:hypothetical protein